jgi:hypothetical protein
MPLHLAVSCLAVRSSEATEMFINISFPPLAQRCRLLRNRALKWINLHEDQLGEQLNAVDPFLGGMAASSPSGGNEDPEVYAWQANAFRRSSPVSLLEFRRRSDFTRERLKYLLSHTAPLLQAPATKGNNLRILGTELASTFSAFCALRGCSLAWQDVETGDAELMSRAATALLELGIREKASNAENDT